MPGLDNVIVRRAFEWLSRQSGDESAARVAERALPAPPDGVPGFIGPDAWYADPSRDEALCARVG
jgi:hypothetical protein